MTSRTSYPIIYNKNIREEFITRLKQKISGVYNRSSFIPIDFQSSQWDNFYRKRQENNVEIDENKYLLYYLAFKELGFLNNLTTAARLLQLGVGHGRTLKTIIERKKGVSPIGLDISFLALTQLKKSSSYLNVIQGDALSLPFVNDSFDRIFEVGVVEHFYDFDDFEGFVVNRELIISSFKELYRTLKPDGMIGFIQPSKHSVLKLSQKIDQFLGRWEFGFQENFAISEFCQLVAIAGFKDIRYLIIQAPRDFPKKVIIGDKLTKIFYNLTGQYRKAELTGALFCLTAKK